MPQEVDRRKAEIRPIVKIPKQVLSLWPLSLWFAHQTLPIMKFHLSLLSTLVAFSLTSCYWWPPYQDGRYYDDPNRPQQPPYQENQQQNGQQTNDPNQLPDGQSPDAYNPPQNGFNQPNGDQITPSNPNNNNQSKPSIPVARAVPGKPGFVFSPYNNKIINAKGFPSGALVADPNYPRSEKKYFRVP